MESVFEVMEKEFLLNAYYVKELLRTFSEFESVYEQVRNEVRAVNPFIDTLKLRKILAEENVSINDLISDNAVTMRLNNEFAIVCDFDGYFDIVAVYNDI